MLLIPVEKFRTRWYKCSGHFRCGGNLETSVWPSDDSICQQEEPGIKPLTRRLEDNPLYHLSPSYPLSVCIISGSRSGSKPGRCRNGGSSSKVKGVPLTLIYSWGLSHFFPIIDEDQITFHGQFMHGNRRLRTVTLLFLVTQHFIHYPLVVWSG